MSGQNPFTPDQAGANAAAPSQSVTVTTSSSAVQINRFSGSVRIVTDAAIYVRLGSTGVTATLSDTKLSAGTHVLGKGSSDFIAMVAAGTANVNICTGEGGLSSGLDGGSGGGGTSVPVDQSGNVPTSSATLAAGENQDIDAQEIIIGAAERVPVDAGAVDFLLGTVGSQGDYLKRLDIFVIDSAKTQIVLRDGDVAPVLSMTTHDTTASTTTVINTAVNANAVDADQYRGCLMRIGNEFRRVRTHGAFAAGVVNQYTVDRAFTNAPGLSAAFTIEDRRYTFEVVPTSSVATGTQWTVEYRSVQGRIRLSLESGVRVVAHGAFE